MRSESLGELLLAAHVVEAWDWATTWRVHWPTLVEYVGRIGRVGTVTGATS